LVRLGHLLTGSATVAEDVVHDAFIGLARNRRKVRDPAAYLRRSVVNLRPTRYSCGRPDR
jgi:DNA-directed RNA polymerase specialized sigma24 family protein